MQTPERRALAARVTRGQAGGRCDSAPGKPIAAKALPDPAALQAVRIWVSGAIEVTGRKAAMTAAPEDSTALAVASLCGLHRVAPVLYQAILVAVPVLFVPVGDCFPTGDH